MQRGRGVSQCWLPHEEAHVIRPKKYPVTVKLTLAPWAGPSEQWMSEENYFILNGEKLGPKLAPLEGVMEGRLQSPRVIF